jgi:hypothetical protein
LNDDKNDDDHLDDLFFVGTQETQRTDDPIKGFLWGDLPQRQPMATQTRSKQQDFEETNEDGQNSRGRGHEALQQLERGCNNTDAGGEGACHTLAGATTRTPMTTTRYSGIGDVVERAGQRLNDNRFITTKLNWQNQSSN